MIVQDGMSDGFFIIFYVLACSCIFWIYLQLTYLMLFLEALPAGLFESFCASGCFPNVGSLGCMSC